jgi:methyl-accepting chemotaxis protein
MASNYSVPATSAGGYVKFSDKLTDSIQDITKMINEHKEMIDAIQDVGIQLTGAIGTLHTLTVKYAGVVNGVLDMLLPLLKGIPFVPPQLLEMATTMEKITQQIIDTSANTSKTITDVNVGLKTGDVARLRSHSGELQQVTQSLTAILPNIK